MYRIPHPPTKELLHCMGGGTFWGKGAFIWDTPAALKVLVGVAYITPSYGTVKRCAPVWWSLRWCDVALYSQFHTFIHPHLSPSFILQPVFFHQEEDSRHVHFRKSFQPLPNSRASCLVKFPIKEETLGIGMTMMPLICKREIFHWRWVAHLGSCCSAALSQLFYLPWIWLKRNSRINYLPWLRKRIF